MIKFNPQNPLDALEAWLDTYLNFEKMPKKDFFWLDTMQFLCKKCNNPQNTFQSFHVAGSKGKGSVSTFIASILTEAAIDCGLYTSPHLRAFSERVTKSHAVLDDSIYANAYKELSYTIDSIIPKTYPNQREPSWFELATLFAFISFKEAGFPWAVLETGLGGRLDATNVILPAASVITEIELEHQEYLGNTVEAIAREKAGIIKKGIPVFCSSTETIACAVFKAEAKKKNAPYFHLDDFIDKVQYSYHEEKMKIEASMPELFSRPLKASLQLLGAYQVRNALLASFVVKKILPQISQRQIETGLENAFIPGRFQIIKKTKQNPLIVADGAHTKKSISHCLSTLQELFLSAPKKDSSKQRVEPRFSLLFACAMDKDVEAIAHLLVESNLFTRIFLTKPGAVKQTNLEKANEAFEKAVNAEIFQNADYGSSKNSSEKHIEGQIKKSEVKPAFFLIESYEEAMEKAFQEALKQDETLVVTGSFYLVSELHSFLANSIRSSSNSA
jgi:dihydrofolate synthase/folylpolyglutamate synthase